MSCCGSKRKEWMNEMKTSSQNNETDTFTETIVSEKPEKIFEYTGNSYFKVLGPSSGKFYHFRFSGEQLNIKYEDSFALMAEGDLKIVTR